MQQREPKTIITGDICQICVTRASGSQILGFRYFETMALAIQYINETPADQQWHILLSITNDHTYTNYLPVDDPTAITTQAPGPGYHGAFYD